MPQFPLSPLETWGKLCLTFLLSSWCANWREMCGGVRSSRRLVLPMRTLSYIVGPPCTSSHSAVTVSAFLPSYSLQKRPLLSLADGMYFQWPNFRSSGWPLDLHLLWGLRAIVIFCLDFPGRAVSMGMMTTELHMHWSTYWKPLNISLTLTSD